jgi:hypothetical protein
MASSSNTVAFTIDPPSPVWGIATLVLLLSAIFIAFCSAFIGYFHSFCHNLAITEYAR